MSNENQAVYLYGLAKENFLNTVTGNGIDQDRPLRVEPFNGIAAVYSLVDLTDFTGPEAEANLQDINWIGPRALGHNQVVAQIFTLSPVLPARFGTIFSSLERLQHFLKTHYDAVVGFLDQMTSRQEWSLKGYLDKKKLVKKQLAADIEAQSEKLDKLAPGVRYFQEKKLEDAAQNSVSLWLQNCVANFSSQVEPFIVESADRKILSREATGKETDMVINWALLLEKERVAELEAMVQQVNGQSAVTGLVLELSGPWPPYSFCPTLAPDAD